MSLTSSWWVKYDWSREETETGMIFLLSEWDIKGHNDQVNQDPKRKGSHVFSCFA